MKLLAQVQVICQNGITKFLGRSQDERKTFSGE